MGSEAKARLGLWFMLAVSLFTFNQLFATGDYPGPAILGMLIATGIAVGARRLGLSTPVTFLVSLATLAWYLSLVFHARFTFWSLPTPDSLNALWRSLYRAYEHSQVDYAPIPIRPGYAIIIVAALWVATTVGEISTFRWRRPLMASLMPIVIFAFAMTVGTGTGAPAFVAVFLTSLLTYWGLESAHRLRSWGRWVSAWSHHRDAEPESLTGDLARRLGAAAVMAAVISPLFLPALNEGILRWRSGIGPGSGEGGTSGRINPWVSIVPGIPNQTDAELFQVDSRDAAYWRIASLEIFDGEDWREAEEARVPADGGSIGGPGISVTASEPLIQTYAITGLRGEFLPAAVFPTQATRLDVEGPEAVAGIDYDPDSGAILVDDELEEGDIYEVSSNVPAIQYEDLIDAEPAQPGEIDDVFFQLRQRLPVEVDELIANWTRKAETPFEKLVAIQERLRSFEYELEPPTPQGESLVADFLLNTKQGFCQHFATAFAAIARQLNYPARVSVGFLPGEKDQISNVYTVRGTDAHAWPEVYFSGYGWIAFEPTPRGESVAPQYTLEPVFAGGDGGGFDLGGNPFQSTGVQGAGQGGGAFDNPGGGDGAGAGLPDGRTREQFLQARREARQGRAEWEKTFARVAIVSASALLLFLLFVPAFKEMRIRRRYARAADPNSIATAAFTQFQEEAAELAESRRPSESALSYAIRMATARRVADRTALRLAQIYEAAAYSSNTITVEQAEEARRLAQALRRQLWHQASWWSRAGRLFSPKGLTES